MLYVFASDLKRAREGEGENGVRNKQSLLPDNWRYFCCRIDTIYRFCSFDGQDNTILRDFCDYFISFIIVAMFVKLPLLRSRITTYCLRGKEVLSPNGQSMSSRKHHEILHITALLL